MKNLSRGRTRSFAGAQDDELFKLGAKAQERNSTAAPQTRQPKLVGLRCRSTRPTTLVRKPDLSLALRMTSCLSWVQKRRSGTQLRLHNSAGQSMSGCAAAPPDLRPRSVGLRCRSTRPTTTVCRVALPLHPTYDHVLSGCAAAPPDLRLLSVGLRCRSTRPTATFCRVALPLHPTYDYVLSGCAAAPPDLRLRSVGLRLRPTRPAIMFCRVALPLHRTCDYDYVLSGSLTRQARARGQPAETMYNKLPASTSPGKKHKTGAS